ncbi:hypothetical protein B9Q11_04240 [Candidatus Marsarchaeota G2 archaeon ECH_B_SAG-F08]|uniref:Stage II sporulation protein M n=1 Tax=Candidatus Marsarchaeota G2 archaeon ECH_B_SAG-F08 TaxID=1978165 RepID=A0A2R6BFG3_9ARCH|nr:MAG: hypothetical protein B9Q11_04240 [Candidatus Marsarchaeota G2 archaeon ECH_B_SAG-F08]
MRFPLNARVIATVFALLCVEYIVFWFVSNSHLPISVVSVAPNILNKQTVAPPPSTDIPSSITTAGTIGQIKTVIANSTLLGYAFKIFENNFVIALIESIPIFGFGYSLYIQVKLGVVTNFASRELNPLIVTGALVSHTFFWLEELGFAFGCAAGFILLERTSVQLRVARFLVLLLFSAAFLFASAILEVGFILRYG